MWRLLPIPLLSACLVTGAGERERLSWWYELSAGYQTTCGLLADATVECWGENDAGVPEEEFNQVSAGYLVSCGVTVNDEVRCWGPASSTARAVPALPDVRAVSTLGADACALDYDGAVTCWGDTYELTQVPAGTYTALEVGEWFACARDADQHLTCWGHADQGETTAPTGTFEAFDVADDHGCAVSADDGTITCWGDQPAGSLAQGDWADVACGWDFACGLDFDGKVSCVDSTGADTLPQPSGARFVSIDAGYDYVCGVRYDGTGACWGTDDVGETAVPHNP